MAVTRGKGKQKTPRGCKGNGEGTTGRSQKRQKTDGGASTSQARKPKFYSNRFRTEHMEGVYRSKFADKPVAKGRHVLLDEFSDFQFSTWLRQQGWTDFLSVEDIVYPNLVRQFYCNMNKDHVTYVKGVEIALEPELISELFHMPYTDGIFSIQAGKAQTVPTITRAGYMAGGSVGRLASKDLKDLNLRLLHYVTVYALFPRAGSFTEVTTHDALCIHATSQGLPFSLPLEILDHVVRCRNRTGGALPYGMQITRILRHFGVNFSGEDKIDAKQADVIGVSVCNRFGYVHDVDSGQWVPRAVQAANPQGAEAGGRNEHVGGGEGEENVAEVGMNEQLQQQGGISGGEQSRVAVDGKQRASIDEAAQQLSPHIYSVGLHTPPVLPNERIPANLYQQLKGIKEDLLTHISQCFASMQKPHHVDASPSVETTPTPMHHTPITASPTVQLYTPIPTPTVVLTPSPAPAQIAQPDSAYSVAHSPISSPSFADLPHASSQPLRNEVIALGTSTGPTSSTPTTSNHLLAAKIDSLIATVNRLAARVDGFDHRLTALEESMSDKATSMAQVIEQGSRRMQSSHTNLTNAVENFMIHLFHPTSNTPPPHQAGSHYTPQATYTPVNLQNPSTSQQAPHNKRSRRQRH